MKLKEEKFLIKNPKLVFLEIAIQPETNVSAKCLNWLINVLNARLAIQMIKYQNL
ncbi:hypothetical protein GCM10007940_14680 [Portibacter lacus]|uniref:Uncharacterized protein n=1 Tax=Portibacter lacus TaxID=1099794 RepID=A0AA37SLT8_9BACT|nr:hypothetical protein GCM10007940_14680 [Portibacter lacus]